MEENMHLFNRLDDIQDLLDYSDWQLRLEFPCEGYIKWALYNPVTEVNFKGGSISVWTYQQGSLDDVIDRILEDVERVTITEDIY
jgi:hypothetical protein